MGFFAMCDALSQSVTQSDPLEGRKVAYVNIFVRITLTPHIPMRRPICYRCKQLYLYLILVSTSLAKQPASECYCSIFKKCKKSILGILIYLLLTSLVLLLQIQETYNIYIWYWCKKHSTSI